MTLKKYYTYMLRCTDNSIYTGITNDFNKRMNEHFHAAKEGAKYTKSHTPQKVIAAWESADKSSASKLEYHIKKLAKKEKESLALGVPLKNYLEEKMDTTQYGRIKLEEVVEGKYL